MTGPRFFIISVGIIVGASIGFMLAFSRLERKFEAALGISQPGTLAPAAIALCTLAGFVIASQFEKRSRR